MTQSWGQRQVERSEGWQALYSQKSVCWESTVAVPSFFWLISPSPNLKNCESLSILYEVNSRFLNQASEALHAIWLLRVCSLPYPLLYDTFTESHKYEQLLLQSQPPSLPQPRGHLPAAPCFFWFLLWFLLLENNYSQHKISSNITSSWKPLLHVPRLGWEQKRLPYFEPVVLTYNYMCTCLSPKRLCFVIE